VSVNQSDLIYPTEVTWLVTLVTYIVYTQSIMETAKQFQYLFNTYWSLIAVSAVPAQYGVHTHAQLDGGYIKYRGMMLECSIPPVWDRYYIDLVHLKAMITGTLKFQPLPSHLNYMVLFLDIAHLNVQHCIAMWSRLTTLISWRLEKVWARMCYHWHKFGYRCAVFPTRSLGRVGSRHAWNGSWCGYST